jgi:hypothetical protein
VGETPWVGQLPPGKHQLWLGRSGYTDLEREIELPAAHASELTLSLVLATPSSFATAPAANAPPARPFLVPIVPQTGSSARDGASALRPWAWLTLGVGAGALIAAGGFELARRSSEDDARSAGSQLAYADALETMQSRRTTARILAGIGAVAVSGGGVLLLVSRPRSAQRATWATSLVCAPESCLGKAEVALP